MPRHSGNKSFIVAFLPRDTEHKQNFCLRLPGDAAMVLVHDTSLMPDKFHFMPEPTNRRGADSRDLVWNYQPSMQRCTAYRDFAGRAGRIDY